MELGKDITRCINPIYWGNLSKVGLGRARIKLMSMKIGQEFVSTVLEIVAVHRFFMDACRHFECRYFAEKNTRVLPVARRSHWRV